MRGEKACKFLEQTDLPIIEIALEGIGEERLGEDADTFIRQDFAGQADDNVIIQGIAGNDTSLGWVGFAFAEEIFTQARARGVPLTVETVRPIPTAAHPLPARRPANSRLDLRRLRERFGLVPPHWRTALAEVMDQVGEGPS